MKTTNLTVTLLVMMATADAIYAQKQPQVQQISVRAPENIKIDGKLDEWPSPNLNAYNATNRIYYVVSNDDGNLYFTNRGLGNGVAKKAVAGGMVITISRSEGEKGRKAANDGITVKFPRPQDREMVNGIMGVINQVGSYDDPVANRKQIDSIVVVADALANKVLKEIGVSGVKNIPDSVISRYNEYGIKAAFQFNKMQPVIELAIPLKYLDVPASGDKIRYSIKLNAVPDKVSGISDAIAPENVTPNVGYALNPTDLWGEYTLAKKP